MKRIFFTVMIIFAAVLVMPRINTYAAGTELSVGHTADENSVTLNWSVSGKESIKQSTVFRYDTESKKYVLLANTHKTEYTDSVSIEPGKSIRYKIFVTLEHGKSMSKTVKCYAGLPDIPAIDTVYEGEAICKAYIYSEETEKGKYSVIYHNYFGDKVIAETDSPSGRYAVSADGKTVFYDTDDGSIYRYSNADGKNERIFDSREKGFKLTISDDISDNGEYCGLIRNAYTSSKKFYIWYDGKLKPVKLSKGRFYYIEGICNDGTVLFSSFYDDDEEQKSYFCMNRFDFGTGKSKLLAKLEYDSSDNDAIHISEAFSEENTYLIFVPGYGFLSGKFDSDPVSVYSEEFSAFSGAEDDVFFSNGKTVILSSGEYIYSIDLLSGNKTIIAKVMPETPNGNYRSVYEYFVCSDDLDTILYIDHDRDCLVRLSDYDDKKGEYSSKQEIKFDITGYLRLFCTSNNMNIAYIYEIGKNRWPAKKWVAFFQDGKFVNADDMDIGIICSDVYDRMFCYKSREKNDDTGEYVYKDLMILNPDGSTTTIYEGYFDDVKGDINTFLGVYFTEYSFNEEVRRYVRDSYDVYYVDENGTLVFWWYEKSELIVDTW